MARPAGKSGTDDLIINALDSTELKYWAGKLGVSQKEIELAVKEVGNSLTAVTKHLRLKR